MRWRKRKVRCLLFFRDFKGHCVASKISLKGSTTGGKGMGGLKERVEISNRVRFALYAEEILVIVPSCRFRSLPQAAAVSKTLAAWKS